MTTSADRQQPSSIRTFAWAIFFFFVFALVLVTLVRWSGPGETYEDTRGVERRKIYEEVWNDGSAKLATAAIVDKDKGIVQIPIDGAKKLVAVELKAKKVGPSAVKVDAWLPMPPAADPNAAEPPPAALPSAPQGADTVRFDTAPSK